MTNGSTPAAALTAAMMSFGDGILAASRAFTDLGQVLRAPFEGLRRNLAACGPQAHRRHPLTACPCTYHQEGR